MAEKEKDFNTIVKNLKEEEGRLALDARMQSDAELATLKSYTLRDTEKQPKPIPFAVSVTLNDAAVFAANVESSLGRAVEQRKVESEDKKLDTDYIEDFIRLAFAEADYRLGELRKPSLNPYTDQANCRRGRSAARCLFRWDKESQTLIPDITPWDPRHLYYKLGREGLDFGAYETKRSMADILADYPEAKEELGTSLSAAEVVLDEAAEANPLRGFSHAQ
ncbi:hypothetical protein ES708_18185 [subsurface metagenome]